MPRKKVVEEKAKEGVTVTIDVEGFVRVRDSVGFFFHSFIAPP